MTIGDRIKARRDELGMSQEELAHKIGYKSKTSINKIELGIQLITKEPIGSREITIISVAIGLGYGLGATSGATAQLPYYIQLIFGGSGIVPCSLAAILLNIILPKGSSPVRKMWDIEDEK